MRDVEHVTPLKVVAFVVNLASGLFLELLRSGKIRLSGQQTVRYALIAHGLMSNSVAPHGVLLRVVCFRRLGFPAPYERYFVMRG